MANDTSTGGVLTPSAPLPVDDDALDAVLQALVSSITGLDGSLVRPRWQAVIPKQPDPSVNWCAIGIVSSTEQNFPSYSFDQAALVGTLVAHEEMQALASFYGPQAKGYAQLLRNGLKVPQNTEQLIPFQMRYIDSGAMRNAPEFVNEQWIKRQDLPMRFRRKLSYTLAVTTIQAAEVDLTDDTGVVNEKIIVPPGTTLEP